VARGMRLPHGLPVVAVGIIAVLLVAGLFAPFLAPHDPTEVDLARRLRPPVFLAGGAMDYPLGTDSLGRDIVSRIIYGARTSLTVGIITLLTGGTVGTAMGLLAGYKSGWIDTTIMRLVDVSMSVPSILLALVFAVAVGASFWVVVGVLAFVLWSRFARVVRGEVLSLKRQDYVAIARIAGASDVYIILRHILPNVLSSILVLGSLMSGWTILAEATLSFLGAGIPPPTPTWGAMVSDGRLSFVTNWWLSVLPGIAIGGVVIAANSLGDWLRDTLDPKLRQL
jgi:peptide/nickel transport system permease protein